MDLTTALALFGAVTGAGSLGWTMWSHRLTGGRVRVSAQQIRVDDHWLITTSVTNTGRLDVEVIGYMVWLHHHNNRLRRLRWRLRLGRDLGFREAWTTTLAFHPSVVITAPVSFDVDDKHHEFPYVLKAGTVSYLPEVMFEALDFGSGRLRVAVRFGAHRPIEEPVRDAGALRPPVLDGLNDAHPGPWSIRLGRAQP
ncbi:hypothetical protein [Streptomyces sp. NPDC054784]